MPDTDFNPGDYNFYESQREKEAKLPDVPEYTPAEKIFGYVVSGLGLAGIVAGVVLTFLNLANNAFINNPSNGGLDASGVAAIVVYFVLMACSVVLNALARLFVPTGKKHETLERFSVFAQYLGLGSTFALVGLVAMRVSVCHAVGAYDYLGVLLAVLGFVGSLLLGVLSLVRGKKKPQGVQAMNLVALALAFWVFVANWAVLSTNDITVGRDHMWLFIVAAVLADLCLFLKIDGKKKHWYHNFYDLLMMGAETMVAVAVLYYAMNPAYPVA